MRRNGYFCTSGKNLDTAVRFADPDFLLGCKISAIRRCFALIFAFNILIVRHISTSGLFNLLTYKLASIISTKFEVDMTIHCRVIACLPADTSRDFVTLTFDLLTLNSCCAWRVTFPTLLPSLKTLRISVLDLWVITFPVGYHWKCVRGHCAFAESRDPCVGGQKQLHFLVCWTPICLFTMQLRWLYDENNYSYSRK